MNIFTNNLKCAINHFNDRLKIAQNFLQNKMHLRYCLQNSFNFREKPISLFSVDKRSFKIDLRCISKTEMNQIPIYFNFIFIAKIKRDKSDATTEIKLPLNLSKSRKINMFVQALVFRY